MVLIINRTVTEASQLAAAPDQNVDTLTLNKRIEIKNTTGSKWWNYERLYDENGKMLGYMVMDYAGAQPALYYRAITKDTNGQPAGIEAYLMPSLSNNLPAGETRWYNLLSTKTLPNLEQIYDSSMPGGMSLNYTFEKNGVYLVMMNGGEEASSCAIIMCMGGLTTVFSISNPDYSLIKAVSQPNTIQLRSARTVTKINMLKLAGY